MRIRHLNILKFHQMINAIVGDISQRTGVPASQIFGDCRKRKICRARYEAMFIVRDKLQLSLPKIGYFFNRDHSTVLYAIKTYKSRLDAKGASVPQ